MTISRKTNQQIPFFLSLVLLLSLRFAQAGSVLIWPLDPVLEHKQTAVALWLENRNLAATQMQVRVMRWQQIEGKDELSPQNEIMVSPPFAQIEPSKRQMIRLLKNKNVKVPAGEEIAYRILIDEAAPAKKTADSLAIEKPKKPTTGLVFQMRYSVPLFVSGEGIWTKQDYERPRNIEQATLPKLKYRMIKQKDKSFLEIQNTGAVHARISRILSNSGTQQKEWMSGLIGYVLPGATIRLPLNKPISLGANEQLQIIVNEYPKPITLEKY